MFPGTSGAMNPIVIVKIFIFIFHLLKVVLLAKRCKGGWCNLEGWSRLLRISQTQKNYIYPPAGGAITYANMFLPITPKPYVVHSNPQIP